MESIEPIAVINSNGSHRSMGDSFNKSEDEAVWGMPKYEQNDVLDDLANLTDEQYLARVRGRHSAWGVSVRRPGALLIVIEHKEV